MYIMRGFCYSFCRYVRLETLVEMRFARQDSVEVQSIKPDTIPLENTVPVLRGKGQMLYQ